MPRSISSQAAIDNLCGKMDARKRNIPKSELAGLTSSQRAVAATLDSALLRENLTLQKAGEFKGYREA
jgi:hypothetical protein